MINIFDFKRYFKKLGDNTLARVGYVNHYFPVTGVGTPGESKLKPEYIGQMYLQTDTAAIWFALGTESFNNWVQYQID
jgi:hypothetical protein